MQCRYGERAMVRPTEHYASSRDAVPRATLGRATDTHATHLASYLAGATLHYIGACLVWTYPTFIISIHAYVRGIIPSPAVEAYVDLHVYRVYVTDSPPYLV